MDRGSSKHAPWLDDQLEQEVRNRTHGSLAGARAEEARDPEPLADGEPEPSSVPRPAPESGIPLVMSDDDVAGRSRLGRYLPRSVFPAGREALLSAARSANAPDDIIEQLERLPAGVTFRTVARVWTALGHPMDRRF